MPRAPEDPYSVRMSRKEKIRAAACIVIALLIIGGVALLGLIK